MARIGFEIPPSLSELVALINRNKKWNLTVIDTGGHVYGHYETDYGHFRETMHGAAVVYSGDVDDAGHALLVSETDEGALIFLSGIFLGLYGERRLEEIQDEVAGRTDRFL